MVFFFLKNLKYLLRKSVINNTINKFKFISLYKKKTKLKFNFLIFIKLFLVSEIIKKKHNQNQKRFRFNQKYIFGEDWFSINIPIWDYFLKKELNFDSQLDYLEIGVFEGRSIIYICEKYKDIQVTCVDPYDKYENIESSAKKQEMSNIYKTFQSNTKNLRDRINHHKINSSDFFKINNKTFDIIYIDGSHFYLDVYNDFENSLKILKNGGLIILDDFLWNYYEKIEDNPINGIMPIIVKRKNLQIISASNQLIIKKIES